MTAPGKCEACKRYHRQRAPGLHQHRRWVAPGVCGVVEIPRCTLASVSGDSRWGAWQAVFNQRRGACPGGWPWGCVYPERVGECVGLRAGGLIGAVFTFGEL